MEQKYESAYYCWIHHPGCERECEHYMMFEGIRTRHTSKEEVILLCKKINAERGLPNVTLQYMVDMFYTEDGVEYFKPFPVKMIRRIRGSDVCIGATAYAELVPNGQIYLSATILGSGHMGKVFYTQGMEGTDFVRV